VFRIGTYALSSHHKAGPALCFASLLRSIRLRLSLRNLKGKAASGNLERRGAGALPRRVKNLPHTPRGVVDKDRDRLD
jgi:hypothetical protein